MASEYGGICRFVSVAWGSSEILLYIFVQISLKKERESKKRGGELINKFSEPRLVCYRRGMTRFDHFLFFFPFFFCLLDCDWNHTADLPLNVIICQVHKSFTAVMNRVNRFPSELQ